MSTTAAEEARVGMGAIPRESGVAFRVWAPHAEAVCVTGSFNDWSADSHPMTHEGGGDWYADIASASVGDEYRYRIVNGVQQLLRIDPYARQVSSSVGNAVVADGCPDAVSRTGVPRRRLENQADNVLAYHRWHQGGPGDDVVVVVNLSRLARENYQLGFPSPGTWRLRLNSDWNGYSRAFGNQACADVVAGPLQNASPNGTAAVARDGFPAMGTIAIGPYSVLVFSQETT